jgi:hypothetical protein
MAELMDVAFPLQVASKMEAKHGRKFEANPIAKTLEADASDAAEEPENLDDEAGGLLMVLCCFARLVSYLTS